RRRAEGADPIRPHATAQREPSQLHPSLHESTEGPLRLVVQRGEINVRKGTPCGALQRASGRFGADRDLPVVTRQRPCPAETAASCRLVGGAERKPGGEEGGAKGFACPGD